MYACITRETFVYSFSASVSFDYETRLMSTCMLTLRSNYTDMSIWKKHANNNTNHAPFTFVLSQIFLDPFFSQQYTPPP